MTTILPFITFHRVGVVFAFFSNEQTFRSLEDFQGSINEVADTGVNYVNDTVRVSHNSCLTTVLWLGRISFMVLCPYAL